MIFLTVLSVLMVPSSIIADSGNLDPATVADAFYQGVNALPTLDPIFDITLPAEGFYLSSLHSLQSLGIANYTSHAKNVKLVVENVFPKINSDVHKKILTNVIANFLLEVGMVNEDNLHELVDQFISSLQRGLIKANGNRALLSVGGFNGVISFLASSGALNPNNAKAFLKLLLDSYLEVADSSSFQDSLSVSIFS